MCESEVDKAMRFFLCNHLLFFMVAMFVDLSTYENSVCIINFNGVFCKEE